MDSELSHFLTENQIQLLSKTLKLEKKNKKHENTSVKSRYVHEGLAEELDLSHSFTPLVLEKDPVKKANLRRLFNVWEEHEAFSGKDSFPDLFFKQRRRAESSNVEEDELLFRPDAVRKSTWAKKATTIQSAWRGSKSRRKTLQEFEKLYA